jgi:NAD(P)-dependent dehydrogenase (short-subunit alcohol dehydrogenase family)
MDINKLFNLEGKVALVTGGSRGIGYMIAEGLTAAGVRVYICARKEAEMSAAAKKLGCEGFVADLSKQADIERVVGEIERREKALHILVNNAGATWGAKLDEFPRENFERVMNVNVTAPFALTQRALKLLRAAASAADPARIINIASIDGFAPPRMESYPYGASKAGIIMLTRHLAGRLAPEHITVNAIAPGLFPSKMVAFHFKDNPNPAGALGIPLNRVGTTEDIAGTVIFLASRAGSFVTGAAVPVCGGSGTTKEVQLS